MQTLPLFSLELRGDRGRDVDLQPIRVRLRLRAGDGFRVGVGGRRGRGVLRRGSVPAPVTIAIADPSVQPVLLFPSKQPVLKFLCAHARLVLIRVIVFCFYRPDRCLVFAYLFFRVELRDRGLERTRYAEWAAEEEKMEKRIRG